jgi:hypothetical protein
MILLDWVLDRLEPEEAARALPASEERVRRRESEWMIRIVLGTFFCLFYDDELVMVLLVNRRKLVRDGEWNGFYNRLFSFSTCFTSLCVI